MDERPRNVVSSLGPDHHDHRLATYRLEAITTDSTPANRQARNVQ